MLMAVCSGVAFACVHYKTCTAAGSALRKMRGPEPMLRASKKKSLHPAALMQQSGCPFSLKAYCVKF